MRKDHVEARGTGQDDLFQCSVCDAFEGQLASKCPRLPKADRDSFRDLVEAGIVDYTEEGFVAGEALYFPGLRQYQALAKETAIYPRHPQDFSVLYPAIGAANEAGELLGEIKKLIRDDGFRLGGDIPRERLSRITGEMGDVLWYLAALAEDLGTDLGVIAQENLQKLAARKRRGSLNGSGERGAARVSGLCHMRRP